MNISIKSDTKANRLSIEIEGIEWEDCKGAGLYQGELTIQEIVAAIGRDLTKELMISKEETAKVIEYNGQVYYQKGEPSVGHYQSLYGGIDVLRALYQTSRAGVTICPLEINCQLSFGSATPLLAEVIGFKIGSQTPREVKQDLAKGHGIKLSASYLWEMAQQVGELAVEKKGIWDWSGKSTGDRSITVVATGLDGTTMPIVGERYKEAMVGTIALYDGDGQRVSTEYLGSMPEKGKARFCQQFQIRVDQVRQQYPQARHVCLADGALFNWEFLDRTYPEAIHILDFYHAAEHLATAADLIFGSRISGQKQTWYERWRTALKEDPEGVSALIRSLVYYRHAYDYGKKAAQVLDVQIGYFRNNAHRMRYWEYIALGLPIGSGVTEAGCKELIKSRFCRSGMKWKRESGDKVLQLRAIRLSDQWDSFWFRVMRYVA